MKIANWEQLPEDFTFDYDQDQLAEVWDQLHAGDQYAYPLSLNDYDEEILNSQAQAWLFYHNGDYQSAAKIGLELEEHGAVILAKSVAAYCDYLCEDEDEALQLLSESIKICEKAASKLPDCANVHFVNALLMGRYSQRISITKALSQGLGGKIKNHLETTLELEPNHAEAHTAMGLYHAEIIDKIGAMIGGITYGAKKPIALKHFTKSLELTPDTPITLIEYANGLILLNSDEDFASELYKKASKCEAMDALQSCDISFAGDQID
jgi:tetratricopeptide (TPR) repeat protein